MSSDEFKKPSLAKAAVNTIRDAKEAGEELGRLVSEIKEDNERLIRQHQEQILRQRSRARKHALEVEQRAIDEFRQDIERKEARVRLREEIDKKYGRGSWEKIKDIQDKIEKLEAQDLYDANEMRRKMDDLLWWCLGIAAILTYAFKLYK